MAAERPRVRVAAIIMLDDELVLVRHVAHGRSYHLLPGGGVEPGETLEDALIREVREETGLTIEVGAPLLISDTIDPGGHRHIINISFGARAVAGSIGIPEDPRIQAVDIIEPQRLGELDLRPPMAEALQQAIQDGLTGPARYLGSLFTFGRNTGGTVPDAN